MDDLEITRLCAAAVGFYDDAPDLTTPDGEVFAKIEDYPVKAYGSASLGRQDPMSAGGVFDVYAPLHDDAQCMALVKKFRMIISTSEDGSEWLAEFDNEGWTNADLNRAVCLCAAQTQKGKQ